MPYTSRNDALVFGQRTRKNLEYLKNVSNNNQEVHIVTHLANSLLGLIVFPWEQNFVEHIEKIQLDELQRKGWPQFKITKGKKKCKTLGSLIRHIRNVVAHGRIRFSSDSPDINEVVINFEDYYSNAIEPHWCAHLEAKYLHAFCVQFVELLENTIG
jgi:hypothetical protein